MIFFSLKSIPTVLINLKCKGGPIMLFDASWIVIHEPGVEGVLCVSVKEAGFANS